MKLTYTAGQRNHFYKTGDYNKMKRLTSKKGIEVKVILQFKYGKPYKDYKRNTIVNGPNIFLAGSNKAWSNSNYYKENKKEKTVPVMLVYTKTLKKKK